MNKRFRRSLGHVLEGLLFGTGAVFVAAVEIDIQEGEWEHETIELVLLIVIILLSWARAWCKDC